MIAPVPSQSQPRSGVPRLQHIPMASFPKPPQELDDVGRGYWSSVGFALFEQGVLGMLHLPALFQLCVAWSEYLEELMHHRSLERRQRYTSDLQRRSAPSKDYFEAQARYNELAARFGLTDLCIQGPADFTEDDSDSKDSSDEPKQTPPGVTEVEVANKSASQLQFESADLKRYQKEAATKNQYRGGLPLIESIDPSRAVTNYTVQVMAVSSEALAEYQRDNEEASQPAPPTEPIEDLTDQLQEPPKEPLRVFTTPAADDDIGVVV